MRTNNLFIIVFALIAFSGCKEVIHLDLKQGEKRLVVEGRITDKPGPYAIRLTNTYAFTYDKKDTLLFETGATVVIRDDQGNSELLKESTPGIYVTDSKGIVGVVGRSYTLQIITSGGKEYASKPELLRSVPSIDTLYSLTVAVNDTVRTMAYYEYQDPKENGNYYLTLNQYFYGRFSSTDLTAFSDQFFNGQHIRMRFYDTPTPDVSKIQIALFSLSKEAYDFWNQLHYDDDMVGTPYDIPTAAPIGNIFNVSDDTDYAIGYFFASAVSEAEFHY